MVMLPCLASCLSALAGIAFPTGCSINHVAAHYSPNPGDTTALKEGECRLLAGRLRAAAISLLDCVFVLKAAAGDARNGLLPK